MNADRGVSPVVSTVLMVAVVVVLAATVGVAFTDTVNRAKDTNEVPIPVSQNLLSNGGFEQGSTGWEDGNNDPLADDVVRAEKPYSGQYALRMGSDESSPNFVGQDVTGVLEAGSVYRMCAQSKVTDGSSVFYVGVQYYDVENPSGVTPIEKATYVIDWTDYEENCVLTDFGSDQPVESAEVWVYYESGNGAAYVDDVSLKRVEYIADDDRDTDDTDG